MKQIESFDEFFDHCEKNNIGIVHADVFVKALRRKEFEKQEEISNIFKIGNFYFDESEGNYTGTNGSALAYLRGSWVFWEKRQSEIDELEAKLQLCKTENKALLNKVNNSELPKQLIEQGQRLNAQSQQIASLKWQLSKVGFTDNGGELMKPPLGDPPNYLSECEKLNRLG